MQTSAVVFSGPGRACVDRVELAAPGPGQVLLEASVTLISPGTERAFLLGLPNTSGKYPQRPGYNFAGIVAACGEGVTGLAAGQQVVAAAGHAHRVVVEAERAVSVPEGLAAEEAVFFNMLTIALQGVRRARIELGESVIVLGQGLVGLLALVLARLSGAAPVIACDTDRVRLDLSARLGADEAIDVGADGALARVKEMLGGGARVVFEATGAPQPVNTAFDLAAADGRVVLLASTRGETERVNFYRDVHRKGLVVLGAHASARPPAGSRPGLWTWREDAAAVLELMARGRLDMAPFVSHRFPAPQAAEAYGLLASWDPSLIGVILDWRTAT